MMDLGLHPSRLCAVDGHDRCSGRFMHFGDTEWQPCSCACHSPEPPPLEVTADDDWLDWAPGNGPLFRNETPKEYMERREGRRARRRKLMVRIGLARD